MSLYSNAITSEIIKKRNEESLKVIRAMELEKQKRLVDKCVQNYSKLIADDILDECKDRRY